MFVLLVYEMTTKIAHELDRLAVPHPFLRITHGVSDDRPATIVTCHGDLYNSLNLMVCIKLKRLGYTNWCTYSSTY